MADAPAVAPTIPIVKDVGGYRRLSLIHCDSVRSAGIPTCAVIGIGKYSLQKCEAIVHQAVKQGMPRVRSSQCLADNRHRLGDVYRLRLRDWFLNVKLVRIVARGKRQV